ncbi:hypothetical protein MIMGU_mgv1a0179682mg, partial [Erythranthe guttata]
MAQVVAARLIHGAFAAVPGSGCQDNLSEKLRPSSAFSVKVSTQTEKKIRGGAAQVSAPITASRSTRSEPQTEERTQYLPAVPQQGDSSVGVWSKPTARRKTKIVCTIGPSTDTKEMIWKMAEAGMNVARLNMSHGDHKSHQKVIDLVKEYNAQSKDNVIAIMLDTK